MKWLILAIGIATNAAASLLVKRGVEPPHRLPTLSRPWAVLTNWPLLVGLVLYGIAFLTYALALTRLPVNVAQPVLTAGAIAAVAVGSVVFYQETFRPTTAAGIAMVIVGVFLIAQKAT